MITVYFTEVGRDKRSWFKQFTSVSESVLAKEAKRGASLMSRDVDVELNDDCSAGVVIVGGWRSVGRFTIERVSPFAKAEGKEVVCA